MKVGNLGRRNKTILAAAAAALSQSAIVMPSFGGTTGAAETISTAGSTALRNWFVVNTTTFTDVQPGTTLNINGSTYPYSTAEWAPQYNGTGQALVYQLASSSYVGSRPDPGPAPSGNVVDLASPLRFEYHESGSVEGVLELANDQIAPQPYVTKNVDRNPTSGNAVWVNYNEIGGISAGGHAVTPFNENTTNGPIGTASYNNGSNTFTALGDFYGNNSLFTSGGNATAQFNLSGGNLNGGQNAVQLAVSDAVPAQIFSNTTGSPASKPWFSTPANSTYGQGNTLLTAPADTTLATTGNPQFRQVYQGTSTLNELTSEVNPRTGVNFSTGTWNTAGLGNLHSQYVASTATLFVANPGTGLTQLDRTDAQWLETTGRLQNGAAFNMTTRDVNSGTRDVSALETGIDPTWAAGVNDDGNGNLPNGATQSGQASIGSALRFSNKTAGGNQLRPTVQVNRFSVGTLSINDANGSANSNSANPIRALAYSDSTDGSAPYVNANYYTVAGVTNSSQNPNGLQYTIFQNEQLVTVQNDDSSYGTSNPNIQGDPNGDVKSLINNTISSVAAYNSSSNAPASPAAGLLSQGYILPQLMAVQKAQNGLNIANTSSAIVTNPSYNPTLASGPAFTSLVNALTNGNPDTVTAGGGTTIYGGSKLFGTPSGWNGTIPLTSFNASSGGSAAGGNWLAGNFNQNGIRDFYSAVVLAQQAQLALEATTNSSGGAITPLGTSVLAADGSVPNSTKLSSLGLLTNTPVDNMSGGPSKGDLIVLGDLNGDGKFDGKDLYDFAVDASLTDPGSRPIETTVGGVTTFNVSAATINATPDTFGAKIAASVLNKNVALDYLQATATSSQKIEAKEVLTGGVSISNGVITPLPIPAGATPIAASGGVIGYDQVQGGQLYTFDPNGVNSFNKSDVNQDGVVDFNDALAVDALYNKSAGSLTDALSSSIPTPVTGLPEQANLVLATQIDTNTSIGASDLAVVSSALTGSGTTNWYSYAANKSGPGLITFNRTAGSVVNLYSGSSLNINSGTIQILSTMDPFTQNSNTSNPVNTADTRRSLAINVAGGELEYSGRNNPSASGIVEERLSSLNISGGSVVIDPAAVHANRTLLVTAALNISGGTLDLGNSDMIVQGGNLADLTGLVKAGFNGGAWNGSGISSASAAADTAHLLAVGVIQNPGTSPYSTFDGVSSTAADVLVKTTYYGDANLDGVVDGSDYSRIDASFLSEAAGGPSVSGWADGDFNYDGVVDGSDYTLIDNTLNSQGASLAAEVGVTASVAAQVAGGTDSSAVPEPAGLGLLMVGAMGLLGRRRHQA